MKKTASTWCALSLSSVMFCWMGVAKGWNDGLLTVLFLAGLLFLGISWGSIAFDLYRTFTIERLEARRVKEFAELLERYEKGGE